MPRQNLYTMLRTVLGCVLLLGASAASAQPPHTSPVTHGISAGDVTSTSAVIWARTDRNAHMHVLLHSDTPPALHTTAVRAAHDYAGKILLTHLRPNTTYRYTVWFTDTPHPHNERPPGVHGTFRTAPLPSAPQAVTFAWGGDLAGQNVCRDATEGFATLRAVNALALDFFIGLGDIIYADNACTATSLYGNAQVPGDFGPAVTLEDFWAHWKYTRADAGFQRLTARTAYYAVWDDHEVINDFGPLTDHSQTPPYTGEPLLPNGLAAFLDYNPIPQPALTPKRLYRNIPWGRHLELFLLDTRQYRDANAAADAAPAPASSASATTAEVWNITANGYIGQLIFSAVGSYTHLNVLRGTTYFGTVYDDPMLSYFVATGNDVYDLGFLRADDPTFRYFQLYFGQWFPSQGLMSGEFFGFQRAFLGLGYSTDGPFPWQATLVQYGTYGLFTDAHPTWRLHDWIVNGPNYGYKDLSLAPYRYPSASHAFMQGHVKQGPILGHWMSPPGGDQHRVHESGHR